MWRRIPGLVVPALVVLLALAGCATGHNAVDQGSSFQFVSPGGKTNIHYAPKDRQKAPDIHGPSVTQAGKQLRVSDYRGQVVVLNIWGSWCPPCRTEAPELEQVYQRMRHHGVVVLGVDVRDPSRSAPRDFMANHQITYPSIYDPSGRALLPLHDYPKSAVPSTIVLDRKHRVAAIYLHPLLASDLMPQLHTLVSTL